MLNLQGKLTGSGTPVHGTVSMQISIYNHETSTADGNLCFRETQSEGVSNGIFAVALCT